MNNINNWKDKINTEIELINSVKLTRDNIDLFIPVLTILKKKIDLENKRKKQKEENTIIKKQMDEEIRKKDIELKEIREEKEHFKNVIRPKIEKEVEKETKQLFEYLENNKIDIKD